MENIGCVASSHFYKNYIFLEFRYLFLYFSLPYLLPINLYFIFVGSFQSKTILDFSHLIHYLLSFKIKHLAST